MKKYILVLGVLPLLFSCSGSKKAADQPVPEPDVAVVIPCSGVDFFTNKKYFRAHHIGLSLDQVVSKKKALSNARAELAAAVKILVESVVDNYVQSSEFSNVEEQKEHFKGFSDKVVREQLAGVKTICEKLTNTLDGKFKTYIAIELSAQKLVDKFHERMMKDGLLKIDYDYEKFKKAFEEEMQKLNS